MQAARLGRGLDNSKLWCAVDGVNAKTDGGPPPEQRLPRRASTARGGGRGCDPTRNPWRTCARRFLRPLGAGGLKHERFHGFRTARRAAAGASPVATVRRPVGANSGRCRVVAAATTRIIHADGAGWSRGKVPAGAGTLRGLCVRSPALPLLEVFTLHSALCTPHSALCTLDSCSPPSAPLL